MKEKQAAKDRSEMLKRLRSEHAKSFERTQALLKEQKQVQKLVCQAIREKAKTVPEIAAEVGMPTHEVLWYLTAFKKYDIVIEDGMCADYVLYKRSEEKKL
jgi:DNA-directed RNA polymerase specialized sigma subunit